MAHDVFISHSTKDKAIADAVCATLEGSAIRCWIAPRDILPSDEWDTAITRGVRSSKVMVLVFSSDSNDSIHVHREVRLAFSKGIPVVRLRLDNAVLNEALEYYMGSVHWLDAMTQPIEHHLDKLAQTVGALLRQSYDQDSKQPAALDCTRAEDKAAVGPAIAYAPSARFSMVPRVRSLTVSSESGSSYHLRCGTSIELGRQTEVSLPFGDFDEAQHFTEAQRAGWLRLSRRHLRLSASTTGLVLTDVRERAPRDENPGFINGSEWPATLDSVVLDSESKSLYEIAGAVRLSFVPLPHLELNGMPAAPALASIVRTTGIGGCEVRVHWPGADATSRHLLLVLWSGATFSTGLDGGNDLFLLAHSDGIWLGSTLDTPRLTVDSLAISGGELIPLAPGRRISRHAVTSRGTATSFAFTCS
jgi:hypothetical protein